MSNRVPGYILAVLGVVAALKLGQGFLAPVLFAVVVGVALAPPVRWLSRLMPRGLASAVVVLGLVGAVSATAYSLTDEATRFSKRLPSLVRQIRTAMQPVSSQQGPLNQLQQAISELEKSTRSTARTDGTPVTIVEPVDVQREMMSGARRAASFLGQAVLITFLIYFLLAAGEQFKLKFVRISGERLSARKITLQMIDDMTQKIAQFVFYQVWSGALVGAVTWLTFMWLGVKYAGLWGLAAGVLNCVPYFGPTLVLVASGAAALLQFHSWVMVATVAGVSVAVTALEGMVLAPMMLGRAANVNTVAMFVSIMFWGWLWGPLGLVIAVPIMMTIKTVADHVESMKPVSELLGD
ncbi:MAG: AI-2E family transporter [Vicinamibacterales bacterium]